jgi:NADPH:quinone reductase-like Zn-dependent oxidoreductase
MRQVWITRRGGFEVLEERSAADPEPAPGEVAIRVRAAGVNFADILARMGLYLDAPPLPAVVGYEVAGEVARVGAEVGELAVGERVLALTRFGGYSDLVCVPAVQCARLPERLGFAESAAVPVNYLTAWIMLVHLGNVHRGERVLVHNVAGGVGLAALQICRWRGAEVIGTASAGKHERLRALGVAHCIDYRAQDFELEVKRLTAGEGVAIVLDAVGGASFRKSYRCLEHLGRLYLYGVSSFAPGERRSLARAALGMLSMPSFKPVPLMNENRGVHGVNLGHLWQRPALLREMLREIMALVEGGALAPTVDARFPLARAGEAHAYIQARRNFGKVVLEP